MRRADMSLREWGSFVCAHIDWADEYGENILHRCSQFGYTDPEPGTSKVLCPDMPKRLRKVDAAVRKLTDLRKNCVLLWFCAPLRADGRSYTTSQFARMCRINKGKFKAELRKAQNQLEKLL